MRVFKRTYFKEHLRATSSLKYTYLLCFGRNVVFANFSFVKLKTTFCHCLWFWSLIDYMIAIIFFCVCAFLSFVDPPLENFTHRKTQHYWAEIGSGSWICHYAIVFLWLLSSPLSSPLPSLFSKTFSSIVRLSSENY